MATANEELKLSSVGTALKQLRENAGMTTEALAQAIGIDQSTLSKYENGRRAVPLSLLESIAEAIGQPSVVVVAWCLKDRFPQLAEPTGQVPKMLNQLAKEIAGYCPS